MDGTKWLYSSSAVPRHIVQFLCDLHCDFSLFDMEGNVPADTCYGLQLRCMEILNVQALMAEAEWQAQPVYVKSSTIKDPEACLGLFASKHFGRDTFIGYYQGSMLYHNLSGRPQKHRRTEKALQV